MLFVLVCAIACSWFATRMERARRQKAAVEAITESRTNVGVLYDDVAGDDGRLDLSKATSPHDAGWLERLLGRDFFHSARGVDNIAHIDFPPGFVPPVQDIPIETLRRLKDMPDLRNLDLDGMNITDADLQYILPLVQLRHLNLSYTKVTGAGVKRLQEALPNCKIDR